jgi:hypothetical protein
MDFDSHNNSHSSSSFKSFDEELKIQDDIPAENDLIEENENSQEEDYKLDSNELERSETELPELEVNKIPEDEDLISPQSLNESSGDDSKDKGFNQREDKEELEDKEYNFENFADNETENGDRQESEAPKDDDIEPIVSNTSSASNALKVLLTIIPVFLLASLGAAILFTQQRTKVNLQSYPTDPIAGTGRFRNVYGCGTGNWERSPSCYSGSKCNLDSKSCSNSIGNSVYRFECDGNKTDCRENESKGTEKSVGNPGCNKTIQIDVFDKDCRDGNGNWTCGNPIDYFVWYTGDCPSNPSGSSIKLLGKVVDNSSRFNSCPNSRFVYGSSCGNSTCSGAPSYRVTWRQASDSNSIKDNSCWEKEPRFTFENTKNPKGDSDGEEIEVTVTMDDPNIKLVWWDLITSNGGNGRLDKTHQTGLFPTRNYTQTFKVKVYGDGDYIWNHLWIAADTPAQRPELSCTNFQLRDSNNNGEINPGEALSVSFNATNAKNRYVVMRNISANASDKNWKLVGKLVDSNSMSFNAPTTVGDYEIGVNIYTAGCETTGHHLMCGSWTDGGKHPKGTLIHVNSCPIDGTSLDKIEGMAYEDCTNSCTTKFTVKNPRPILSCSSYRITDSNNNGKIEPNERLTMNFNAVNAKNRFVVRRQVLENGSPTNWEGVVKLVDQNSYSFNAPANPGRYQYAVNLYTEGCEIRGEYLLCSTWKGPNNQFPTGTLSYVNSCPADGHSYDPIEGKALESCNNSCGGDVIVERPEQPLMCVNIGSNNTPKRGQTVTFTCSGTGDGAAYANFQIYRDGVPVVNDGSYGESSKSRVALVNGVASWNHTILMTAPDGTYIVKCQICTNQDACTQWGLASRNL